MFVTADLGGSHREILRKFLVYGAAGDIPQGSLVMEGAAAATFGSVIDATATAANIVGLLTQLHDYSVAGDWTWNGTLATATNRPLADVDVRPFAVIRCEIDVCATQTFDADANGADTDISLGTASNTDTKGGSWIYDSTSGDIRYVEDHAATSDVDLNTATSTDWDTIAGYWCPARLYGSVANQGFTPSDDKGILEGNETTLIIKTVDNFLVRDENKGYTRLNPGIHDAISATNPKFFIDFVVLDHAFNNL